MSNVEAETDYTAHVPLPEWARKLNQKPDEQANGYEPPPPNGPEDYGDGGAAGDAGQQERAKSEQDKANDEIQFKTPVQWSGEKPEPPSWLAHQRIPRGDVSSLHGDGGAGKTDIALQLALACARSAPDWLGSVINSGPAVFLSFEEPEKIIEWRCYQLAERDGYDLNAIANLHLWFPDDLKDCTLAVPDRSGVMQPRLLFDRLEKKIAAIGPVLVILDNIAATFVGDQIGRVHTRTFVNLFRGIARGPSEPAVLLLDHPSLSGITSGTGRGGNVDWRNGVRAALYLKPSEDKAEADAGVKILEVVKANYGKIGERMRLRWTNGGLALEGTPSTLQQNARDHQAEEKFLELLALHNRLGIDVGYATGRSYAPKVFSEHPDAGGYTSKVLAAAMQRLLGKKIELETFGPPSKGKKRLVISQARGAS